MTEGTRRTTALVLLAIAAGLLPVLVFAFRDAPLLVDLGPGDEPWTQCFAVTTQLALISVPPQKWRPEASCSETIHEYTCVALPPPTIIGETSPSAVGAGAAVAAAAEASRAPAATAIAENNERALIVELPS